MQHTFHYITVGSRSRCLRRTEIERYSAEEKKLQCACAYCYCSIHSLERISLSLSRSDGLSIQPNILIFNHRFRLLKSSWRWTFVVLSPPPSSPSYNVLYPFDVQQITPNATNRSMQTPETEFEVKVRCGGVWCAQEFVQNERIMMSWKRWLRTHQTFSNWFRFMFMYCSHIIHFRFGLINLNSFFVFSFCSLWLRLSSTRSNAHEIICKIHRHDMDMPSSHLAHPNWYEIAMWWIIQSIEWYSGNDFESTTNEVYSIVTIVTIDAFYRNFQIQENNRFLMC